MIDCITDSRIVIRRMFEYDIDAVLSIEKECFTVPWSRDAFLTEIRENKCARYLVLTVNEVIVAYAGVWLVINEGHITNIAVTEKMRGNGYGERILRELIQVCVDSGISWMTLEVRRSNKTAQNLYRKLKFEQVGYRKGYYSDNNEDALVMTLDSINMPVNS